jgi:hypothetical protein
VSKYEVPDGWEVVGDAKMHFLEGGDGAVVELTLRRSSPTLSLTLPRDVVEKFAKTDYSATLDEFDTFYAACRAALTASDAPAGACTCGGCEICGYGRDVEEHTAYDPISKGPVFHSWANFADPVCPRHGDAAVEQAR